MTQSHNTDRAIKARPPYLRALGAADPPEQIEVGAEIFHRIEIYKHDSWAATALYQSASRKVVCKFNRRQRLFVIPMSWLGRRLAKRESRFLDALSDLENVPNPVGPVSVEGKILANAAAHDYVEGRPVGDEERVNDDFFPKLEQTLAVLHERGIAYIDLHKSENILVGLDGSPHLIDFQASYMRPKSRVLARLTRRLERMLQELDSYHLKKHLTLKRPDIAGYTWDEFNQRNERPAWIKLHRKLATPFRMFRRKLLVLLGVRKNQGFVDSEHFPEAAVRLRHVSSDAVSKARKAA